MPPPSARSKRARPLSLGDLIDLERYPIDQPSSPEFAALVARCRHSLETTALCSLPNFVRADALPALLAEVDAARPHAHRFDWTRPPYSWRENAGFSWPHPRAWRHPETHWSMSTDQVHTARRADTAGLPSRAA